MLVDGEWTPPAARKREKLEVSTTWISVPKGTGYYNRLSHTHTQYTHVYTPLPRPQP